MLNTDGVVTAATAPNVEPGPELVSWICPVPTVELITPTGTYRVTLVGTLAKAIWRRVPLRTVLVVVPLETAACDCSVVRAGFGATPCRILNADGKFSLIWTKKEPGSAGVAAGIIRIANDVASQDCWSLW